MMSDKHRVRISARRADDPPAEVEEATTVTDEIALEETQATAEEQKTEATDQEGQEGQEGQENQEDQERKDDIDWKDVALRMRAEMDNFRRRQTQLADDRVRREKAYLLKGFLSVMDTLETVLSHLDANDPHHQGVRVAYNEMQKVLRDADVEKIDSANRPFDPNWHEAVAIVPPLKGQETDLLVVDVEEEGYRLGERVLRPARVIVAKQE
ncbi:MAG: nucleotide exchange factor GrpE [Anaerolineales bacterium]